jgi:hypothetical protein
MISNFGSVLSMLALTGWQNHHSSTSPAESITCTVAVIAVVWMAVVICCIAVAIYHAQTDVSTHDAHVKVGCCSSRMQNESRARAFRMITESLLAFSPVLSASQILRAVLTLSRTILLLPVTSNASTAFTCTSIASPGGIVSCGSSTHFILAAGVAVLMTVYVALLVTSAST